MEHPRFIFRKYLKSVTIASIIFGSSHGIEEFIHGFDMNRISDIKLSAMMVLFVFESVQSIVFFIFCSLLMLIPTKVFLCLYNTRNVFTYIIAGSIFGVLFLPLCALIANTVLPLPDIPTYFARCVEFFLPMVTAGAVGGYVFWHELDSSANLNKSITNLFS